MAVEAPPEAVCGLPRSVSKPPPCRGWRATGACASPCYVARRDPSGRSVVGRVQRVREEPGFVGNEAKTDICVRAGTRRGAQPAMTEGNRAPNDRAAALEPLSPELVLVSPELREQALAALPDRPWEAFAPPPARVPAHDFISGSGRGRDSSSGGEPRRVGPPPPVPSATRARRPLSRRPRSRLPRSHARRPLPPRVPLCVRRSGARRTRARPGGAASRSECGRSRAAQPACPASERADPRRRAGAGRRLRHPSPPRAHRRRGAGHPERSPSPGSTDRTVEAFGATLELPGPGPPRDHRRRARCDQLGLRADS